jgi:hypothetical protein
MRFAISTEQRQFAASLHEALAQSTDWHQLADLGVTELHRESPLDLVVAFEELGHHAVPGPIVESCAVIPPLLTGLGDPHNWLPAMESGKLTATIAYPPHQPYADHADLTFIINDDALHVAASGTELSSVDISRRLTTTTLGTRLGQVSGNPLDIGALGTAAVQLGLATAMLELTTSYAKQRTQFGRPIGQFQAVKHLLADVLIAIELARPLLHAAAITTTSRDISAAKLTATAAADRSAKAALQVHGAIGYTKEYELSRYLTKTRALRSAWGTPSLHRSRIL